MGKISPSTKRLWHLLVISCLKILNQDEGATPPMNSLTERSQNKMIFTHFCGICGHHLEQNYSISGYLAPYCTFSLALFQAESNNNLQLDHLISGNAS